ncbi:MAG: hypothetical protein JAZ02_19055 [Candidatus Thiodiazotropha endolucinida]|nr:hypothetical protein [Candidatus Thiodiazotropha sp. (ex Lucina pensylvanica)]MCG8026056.1 hypothetical protein [Candidatus Thiodiazotropha endolucinida]
MGTDRKNSGQLINTRSVVTLRMRNGTSQSPFRPRLSRQPINAPAALRPCRFATPSLRSALATQHALKWLDGVSNALT